MGVKKSLTCVLIAALASCGWQKSLEPHALAALYSVPLTPPAGPLSIYHVGHSLVNRDMPAMLEQIAGADHHHRSQLGWGASLKAHWSGENIPGFKEENDHPRYEDAHSAVKSGRFDAVVLTEMVEIKDAIQHFNSPEYLRRWTREARTARASTRVYLYETWHPLNDPKGWLERLDQDLPQYWEGELLAKGLAHGDTGGPVHVIPAGQVMARFVRRVESQGGLPGLDSRKDLFARNADGSLDNIHLNDLGNYLVALTHYAVLYHRSPVGLPHHLQRADGTEALAPEAVVARAMQETVWEVVTRYPKTGVVQAR